MSTGHVCASAGLSHPHPRTGQCWGRAWPAVHFRNVLGERLQCAQPLCLPPLTWVLWTAPSRGLCTGVRCPLVVRGSLPSWIEMLL